MSRAARLLDLIQIFRRSRHPVTAAGLAHSLGVSERTIYRDILTLNAQGADIRGEAGLGYVLGSGFTVPPLMFTDGEIEAVVLGLRWVTKLGDDRLGLDAADALAKITDVLPPDLRARIDDAPLLAAARETERARAAGLTLLREAMRAERKLAIVYIDSSGQRSKRQIWPLVIGFFKDAEVLAAWCEMRQAFRHFRLDRIIGITATSEALPRRRRRLLAEWRQAEGIVHH
ncbi:YafY family protein [Bradyrhizobium sp. WD16]|uniref:helix-turn-helix transcriptional regulator n=1 Tax=Bradyrhizobium sp. WD16 TaxID=1521768 RepID=UPI0020A5ACBA|nr:YafY family protein [Bradyrhizobium sp. WD16]UTD28536.1 transcriptional regulator [Bradyrhizobium sp. WD16]